MKRHLVVLILVAVVALSGCSVLESGDSSDSVEFAESVDFAVAGVAGEPVEVRVQAENIGDSTAEYQAILTVNGENVTTESITLDAGERTTVSLATSIDDAGEYDLTVAGEEQTITIHESPMGLLRALEGDSSRTRIVEEETQTSGVMEFDHEEYDFTMETTATERTNYTAETQYTIENSTTTVQGETIEEFSGDSTSTTQGQTEEETIEEWVVDGTLYQKTTDQNSGEVEYLKEPSDEFEDDTNISDVDVREFLSMEYRDDEYVFSLSASSPDEATQLWAALGEEEDAEIPAQSVQSVTIEFRFDRGTGRPTGGEINVSITDFEMFTSFDMTIRREIVAFDEPVTVSVPDEVRENAEPEEPLWPPSG